VKLGFKLEGTQHAIGREKRLDNKQTLRNNKIFRSRAAAKKSSNTSERKYIKQRGRGKRKVWVEDARRATGTETIHRHSDGGDTEI
jgi:hypothetical protein